MVVEEDIERQSINFIAPHFRENFIAEDQYGQVDTNYRVYKMTLRQIAQKFGWDKMCKLEPNFENDYKANMQAEREVLHVVQPRSDYQPWRIDMKGKKWESVWVYRKGGKFLTLSGTTASLAGNEEQVMSEGGYDTKPIITWRWRKNSDEIYGRGPAHDAFVSIMLDNQMGRANLITAQMAAEPPLVAYSDQRGTIQRGPKAITYLEANRGDIRLRMPQQLITGVQNLPFNVEFQDRVKATIDEHFHVKVFMMMSQLAQAGDTSRMVTEQIQELQNEKAAILSTRIGNLQSEALNPLIERVFDIEARAGRIPTAPDILLNSMHGPVQVQYLGPLSQAQTRLTKVRALNSFLGLVGPLAQVDPSIPHAINAHYILKQFQEATSIAPDCVYDDKTYAQIMQTLQQQAQQEQTAENVPRLAGAAAKLAKAPEAGSILEHLMGGDSGKPN